ncbi:MAG: hypothetical protein ACRDR6_06720 [Pseudonocardiaceae bacterium]
MRELTELGLGEDLARIGVATAENVYCDQFGHTLFTEPRGVAGGHRWPQYSVHRRQLQMLLLAAVCDRCGPHAVRTGTPLVGFEQSAPWPRGLRRNSRGSPQPTGATQAPTTCIPERR